MTTVPWIEEQTPGDGNGHQGHVEGHSMTQADITRRRVTGSEASLV